MKKALFSGTFDPPSLGHLDIIKKGSKICDRLVVGVGVNLSKKEGLFTVEERVKLLKELVKGISNVTVSNFSGPVADYAKEIKANFIIRGLRPFSDFSLEMQMAVMNRKLSGIETLFLLPDENYGTISSTLIRELAFYHANLREFVPKKVEDALYQRQGVKRAQNR
jgi:pantetheine-phosphate adenylyltransferase